MPWPTLFLNIIYISSLYYQSWPNLFNPWIIEHPILALICESDKLDGLSSFRACTGGLGAIFYHVACLCGLEADLHLPHHIALQAYKDKLVFGKSQEASELTFCEIASRELFNVEFFVETNRLGKECNLQFLVSLLDRSDKLIRTQFEDDICVVFAMCVPFVLPKENC